MGTFGDLDGDGRVNDDWLGQPVGGAIGMAIGSAGGPFGAMIGGNQGWQLGNQAMDYFDDLTGADGVPLAPENARAERARQMQEDPWGTIERVAYDSVPLVPQTTKPHPAPATPARREPTITHIAEPTIETIPPDEQRWD